MTGMTGRLLDEVEEHPAHRPGLDVPREPGVVAGNGYGLPEVADSGDDLVRSQKRPVW